MKRLLILLFCLIYLLPAIGVSVDLHRCGKRIKVVNINSSHETKCPCGTKMPFNCCRDMHLSLKISDSQNHQKSLSVINYSAKKLVSIPVFEITAKPFSLVESFDISAYHAPPFKTNPAFIF